MRFMGLNITRQERSAVVAQSNSDFFRVLGLDAMGQTAAGVVVNEASALGVPSVWAAVNFLSATMAGLPLHLYRRMSNGDRKRVSDDPVASILHDAFNDGQSSFEGRKYLFERVFTQGRGLAFIERGSDGKPTNLWPLDPEKTTIRVENGRKRYEYKESGRKAVVYEAAEVIDLPFMLRPDGFGHYSPIMSNRDVIALGIAATQFASKFFQNGGVPPFAVTGGFQSPSAIARASDDFDAAVRKAAKEQRQALVLPTGLEIKPIGSDAEKSQLLETQRFVVEQVARIYGLPPVFLQDLTHGTYTNTEQQDLQLTKHTIKRWVEHTEQELTLKLFGRGNRRFFVEFNMDGLLRGDFKTRMEGYGVAIQNALMTPNEIRQKENMPAQGGADKLMVQGATVPLGEQPKGSANGA